MTAVVDDDLVAAAVPPDDAVDVGLAGWSFGSGTVLGWPQSLGEALALQEALAPLGGLVLAQVLYLHVDYGREQCAPDLLQVEGARQITHPGELAAAYWRTAGPDTVDLGVQLTFTNGQVLSIGWDDVLSEHSGLGLRWGALHRQPVAHQHRADRGVGRGRQQPTLAPPDRDANA